MRRVSVVGVSGSGKTTVARGLATHLGIPYVELDAFYHQPGWVGLDDVEFARRVEAATAGDRWVVDGNYSQIQEIVWSRADTVIVLDLPKWQVMSQLLVRTARRGCSGVKLWNGNRENLWNLIGRDPEKNILLWSWTNHAKSRTRYRAAATDPRWASLTFRYVHSRRAAHAVIEHARSFG